MNTAALIFSVFNILFGIIIIFPCLVAAAFSGDSPKVTETKFFQFLITFLLTLPVFFVVSGLVSIFLFWWNQAKFAIYVDLAPWFWLILVFSVSVLLGKIEW